MEPIHDRLAEITYGSIERSAQVICVRPYALDIDGRTWTIATDGHALVAVMGAHARPLDHAQAPVPAALVRVALALPADPIDLDALRAFIGPYERVRVTPCALCGLPERPVGTWEPGEEECPACEGWGRSFPLQRPVRVRGSVLDANMLGRSLACLDSPAVATWHERDTRFAMFVVRGPSSLACVMGFMGRAAEGEYVEAAVMEESR